MTAPTSNNNDILPVYDPQRYSPFTPTPQHPTELVPFIQPDLVVMRKEDFAELFEYHRRSTMEMVMTVRTEGIKAIEAMHQANAATRRGLEGKIADGMMYISDLENRVSKQNSMIEEGEDKRKEMLEAIDTQCLQIFDQAVLGMQADKEINRLKEVIKLQDTTMSSLSKISSKLETENQEQKKNLDELVELYVMQRDLIDSQGKEISIQNKLILEDKKLQEIMENRIDNLKSCVDTDKLIHENDKKIALAERSIDRESMKEFKVEAMRSRATRAKVEAAIISIGFVIGGAISIAGGALTPAFGAGIPLLAVGGAMMTASAATVTGLSIESAECTATANSMKMNSKT